MKVDNYTNFVLTVIACALVILVFQQAFKVNSAFAWGEGVQKVAICTMDGSACADVGWVCNGAWCSIKLAAAGWGYDRSK